MAILDLFSKRQKRDRGEVPDVYVYDDLPHELRVQIVHVVQDAMVKDRYGDPFHSHYEFLVTSFRRELGVFLLPPTERHAELREELFNYFLHESNVERALDVVELSARVILLLGQDGGLRHELAEDCVGEINGRFLEHGVGYQFEDGQIIRIDSQLVHTEVVKPALSLLSAPHFKGAQEEFLKAHEHYRLGNYKEALNETLKSFESLMKAICRERGWAHSPTAQAKDLIDTCFRNGLVPPFWQSHWAGLRSLLESGVPTGRNKLSGHGQGVDLVEGSSAHRRIRDPYDGISNSFPGRSGEEPILKLLLNVCHNYGVSIRTTIDIPEDTYQALRQRAAAERTSIRKLVLDAVQTAYLATPRRAKRLTGPPVAGSGKPGPLCPDTANPYELIF